MTNVLTITVEEARAGYVIRFGDQNKPIVRETTSAVKMDVKKELDDFLELAEMGKEG